MMRRVIPLTIVPRPPAGRTMSVDGCDADASDVMPSRLAGLALGLVYASANGTETERTITLRKVSRGPDTTFIHAYCHMRRALRCFRLDRVIECFDMETGEQINAEAYFAEHARRQALLSRADVEDVVRVLSFVMHCDGEAALEEVGAISDALSRYLVRVDGTDDDHDEAMNFVRRAAPEGLNFYGALRRLVCSERGPGIAQFLTREINNIIEADYFEHEAETTWRLELCKALARAA